MTASTGGIRGKIIRGGNIGGIGTRPVLGFLQDHTGNAGVIQISGRPGACVIRYGVLNLMLRNVAVTVITKTGFPSGFGDLDWQTEIRMPFGENLALAAVGSRYIAK